MIIKCPYCSGDAKLIDSKEIYGKSYGFMWICRPCNAYVGTHSNSKKHAPLGMLANEELREYRSRAHDVFDVIWQMDLMTRRGAYRWLAIEMGVNVKDCHIAYFDVEQCKRVIEHCEQLPGKFDFDSFMKNS